MSNRGSQGVVKYTDALLIKEREDVIRVVTELRESWDIPKNGFRNEKSHHRWWLNITSDMVSPPSSRYSFFLDDVDRARKSLKLPLHWNPFLITLITRGKALQQIQHRSGKTSNSPVLSVSEGRIKLEFGANTKREDVVQLWPQIKRIQRTLPEFEDTRYKRKRRRNVHLYKKVQGGEKFEKVYKNMSNNFGAPSLEAASKSLLRYKKLIKGH